MVDHFFITLFGLLYGILHDYSNKYLKQLTWKVRWRRSASFVQLKVLYIYFFNFSATYYLLLIYSLD